MSKHLSKKIFSLTKSEVPPKTSTLLHSKTSGDKHQIEDRSIERRKELLSFYLQKPTYKSKRQRFDWRTKRFDSEQSTKISEKERHG